MNETKVDIITKTSDETQKFGEEFAQKIKVGDIITLHGDLGSGKTTFTQGLAKGLGIKKRIISPTFIVVRTYTISEEKTGAFRFYHIDLYWLESKKDIKGLGLEEILNDKKAIVVIEWAEKLGKLMPQKKIDMRFHYSQKINRKITITQYE